MPDEGWAGVDRYLGEEFVPSDPVLDAALRESSAAGLPSIQVSPLQGRLLQVLAEAVRARRILEIGTLGGYSTICLARGLAADGRLLSLELSPHHAEVARRNLARAGLDDRVEIRVGPALDSLARLGAAGEEPFDLVFIDADKTSYPQYLDWSLRLTSAGSLIVADNVVRQGGVADPGTRDPSNVGIRAFLHRLANEPRVNATVIQTVGSKGHDGFALGVVLSGPTPSDGPSRVNPA